MNGLQNIIRPGLTNGLHVGLEEGMFDGLYGDVSKQIPLLNLMPDVNAAYSLRRLNSNYGGFAIRVRRSNDNAEIDIGFNANGELNTNNLLSFVNNSNGLVTTWYDQSGNGRNATQTVQANQPRIVNAGVIELENKKPCIFFDGSNDHFNTSNVADWNFLHQGDPHSVYCVYRAGNVVDPENIYVLFGTTVTILMNGALFGHDTRSSVPRDRVNVHIIGNGTNAVVINESLNQSAPANTQLLSILHSAPKGIDPLNRSWISVNNGRLNNNNTAVIDTFRTGNANHSLRIGTAANASGVNLFFLLGTMQELIFFKEVPTLSISFSNNMILNNINNYYKIY